MLLLFCAFLLATAINHLNYPSMLYYFARTFGLITICFYMFRLESTSLWRALSDYFAICIYINTILTLPFPQGIMTALSINMMEKEIYFLDERNQIMPYYLIAISLTALYYQQFGEKKKGLYCFLYAVI